MSEAVVPAPAAAPRMLKQTHGMAFFTYGSAMALAMAMKGPLSIMFQTKDDAAKQDIAIALNAKDYENLNKKLDDNKKEIIDSFNSVVKPVAKEVDNHETRIVNLEFIQMNKGDKK